MRARGPSALLPLIQDASAPEPQGLAIFSLGALLAIPSEEDRNAVSARRTSLTTCYPVLTITVCLIGCFMLLSKLMPRT